MVFLQSGLRRFVIRRVGGLEVTAESVAPVTSVIRRVGGLEVFSREDSENLLVIRRVGGLEGLDERKR